jgi:hypothetical protein
LGTNEGARRDDDASSCAALIDVDADVEVRKRPQPALGPRFDGFAVRVKGGMNPVSAIPDRADIGGPTVLLLSCCNEAKMGCATSSELSGAEVEVEEG